MLPEGFTPIDEGQEEIQPIDPAAQQIPEQQTAVSQLPEGWEAIEEPVQEQMKFPVQQQPTEQLYTGHDPGKYEVPKSSMVMEQLYSGHLPDSKKAVIEELKKRGLLTGEDGKTFSLSSLESGLKDREESIAEFASRYIRPALSGVMGAGGALAGTAAGPVGTVAGGGLGYAMGEEAADLIDEFILGIGERKPLVAELTESGIDFIEGATGEMGGQLFAAGVGKAIGAGKKAFTAIAKKGMPISKKGAIEAAAEVLAAETSGGPIIAKNLEEAVALEKEIPGLKFSRGQLTNDPKIIGYERARARMSGDVAREQLEAEARNSEAIKKYIAKRKGTEGLEEVVEPLKTQQKVTETGIKKTARELETEAAKLEGEPFEEIGEKIKEAATEGKKIAKTKAGELFEEVPEVEIDGSSIIKKIKSLSKPMSKFEDVSENIPAEFKFFKKVLKESEGVVSPNDLQGLRSSLTDSIRDLKGASSPNNRKISRLTGLLKEVDSVLETAPPVKDVAEIATTEAIEAGAKLKKARTFFKEEVIEKYGKGAIEKILKKGKTGDKVSNANVAGTFFKPGFKGTEAANEFIEAVGKNKNARGSLEDYIQQDLLSSAAHPVTGEIVETKLKTWLSKYKPALKKLGLEKRFDTIKKASEELTKARENKNLFDKSAASKLLKSDVNTAIKNAFGTGSKKQAAIDLMKSVKSDKKAVAGLQNATIEHIIKNAETTAPDAFDNPIISFAKVEKEYRKFKPALEEMFKNAPEKLKALNNFQDALKRMQRGKASPLRGGSDTAENIISAIAIKSGVAKSRVLSVVNSALAPLKQMSEETVNAILNQAAIDPEFAYYIQLLAKGMPDNEVKKRIWGHLSGLVIRQQKGVKEGEK